MWVVSYCGLCLLEIAGGLCLLRLFMSLGL